MPVGGIVVFNLPMGLTIKGRKLHRACLDYKITGGYVKDSQANRTYTFATAIDNWVTRAALKRGRNHWLESHREIFKNNPQLKPKWHDYKVALIKEQVIDGENFGIDFYQTQQVPEDWANNTFEHDDRGISWSVFTTEAGVPRGAAIGSANLVDINKDEFTSHIVGTHIESGQGATKSYQSIGLIESWMKSRPDINPVTTVSDSEMDAIEVDPLNTLFDDGDADNEKIENFYNANEDTEANEGDMYPAYSNQVLNCLDEVAAAACSQASPISYFTGFTALTGQVAMRFNQGIGSGDTVEVVFEVNPRGMTI
tara:strand:+ start:550 stop:1482 length:933 start_codon:yes stop_codon:yes gene_type:complete